MDTSRTKVLPSSDAIARLTRGLDLIVSCEKRASVVQCEITLFQKLTPGPRGADRSCLFSP